MIQFPVYFTLKKELFAQQNHLKKIVCQENTETKIVCLVEKVIPLAPVILPMILPSLIFLCFAI